MEHPKYPTTGDTLNNLWCICLMVHNEPIKKMIKCSYIVEIILQYVRYSPRLYN